MAKTAIMSSGNPSVNAGTTQYAPVYNGRILYNATETARYVRVNSAGVFSNSYLRVISNATSSSTTFVFRVNTADGNQTFSIGAGATGEFEDTSNSDTVAAGDEVSYKLVVGATGAIAPSVQSVLFAANADTVCFLAGCPLFSATVDSQTTFISLASTTNGGAGTATEANAQGEINTAGTLRNMTALISANSRSTTTVLGTRINGGNGSLLISVGAGATGIVEETSATDAVAESDLCNFRITTSTGGGSLAITYMNAEFVTTDGSFVSATAGEVSLAVADGVTTYIGFGSAITSTTEASYATEINIAATVSKMWCYVSANATSGDSTLAFRINAASGNQVLTIGAGATGEFEEADSDVLSATDEIGYQVVNGGGGTLTFRGITQVFTVLSGIIGISIIPSSLISHSAISGAS